MHDTFSSGDSSPNPLTPGYRVVIDNNQQYFDPATLWVREGRLCSGPDLESATPFTGYDYFLIYLESVEARGDDIPSIREAWDTVIEKATQSDEKEVDLAFSAFKSVVIRSPDLIWKDKNITIKALINKVKMIRKLMERRAFLMDKLDTSLAIALAEQQELADCGNNPTQRISRADLIRLDWR